MERLRQFPLLSHGKKRNAFSNIILFSMNRPSVPPGLGLRQSDVAFRQRVAFAKRQRAAALQDASEGHVLPGFREVLDCASPLALWLPLQEWVHGPDARLYPGMPSDLLLITRLRSTTTSSSFKQLATFRMSVCEKSCEKR